MRFYDGIARCDDEKTSKKLAPRVSRTFLIHQRKIGSRLIYTWLVSVYRSNISLSHHSLCGSVDDGLQGSHPQYQDTILTIEELRAQLNSCFT